MKSYFQLLPLLGSILLLSAGSVGAQTDPPRAKPNVLRGPAKAPLSSVAQIELPAGYIFIGGADYRKVLKAEGEPVSGNECGFLKPTNQDWAVVFRFNDIGYVKDDDKDKLNADKLLESIKQGTAAANESRVKAGNPPIEVIGWDLPPRYDPVSHNLEWAIRGSVGGEQLLNYNTRLLGRKGVMQVVLITDPAQLKDTLPQFRQLLAGYSYQYGQGYAEYRPGDKVAKYGLAALVLGGAAVGAAKLGMLTWLLVFLKKGWKLVVVGFAAVMGSLKKLFSRNKEKPQA
ncbi:MAG TPA: DUF2167 domain-containing protein [Verrucomicrobiae bacterium]|nr:DUF2167 domain-containing protein [Verrucomicrobiae bacterium]